MDDPKSSDTASLSPARAMVRRWVARWLAPTGWRAFVLSIFIFALIAGVTLLIYKTGGTRYAWLHLMYLPIILAAAAFGTWGGVMAALVAGLAIGPEMPMNVIEDLPQTTTNWLFRIGFFLLVGVLSGFISNFLQGQLHRLQETHRRLLQAHDELKSAQMKLIQTAKLESVGRLAAGVAHEVKNPLAVIQLGVDFLTTALKDGSQDCRETVQEIGDASRRADAVIKGLLNFSRSEKLGLATADLNSVIDETLLLVRHELSMHHVALEKSLAAGLPKVELDVNKVKQVFINVFVNAAQAMGDSGALSVNTFLQPPGPDNPGPLVVAQIQDTGHGIPEDKLDRMFEPFFTTKPVGSGTGLGLSVSRNIIELHRGTLTIGNRKDKRGAVVTIAFPVPEAR
jgi:signal transduction histidine kinase